MRAFWPFAVDVFRRAPEPQVTVLEPSRPAGDAEAHVDSHPYTPKPGQPWSLCAVCNLSLSAHTDPGPGYHLEVS